MKNSASSKWILLAALNLCGAALSVYSLHHHIVLEYGIQTAPSFCNINATFNCDAVSASRWSTVGGIPIASFGLAFYLGFLVFALFARDRNRIPSELSSATATALSFSAVLSSIYLFVVSKFIIGTICLICLALYGINIALLLISYLNARPTSLRQQIVTGVKALLHWPLLSFGLGRYRASTEKNSACGWLALAIFGALLTVTIPEKIIVANLRVPPPPFHDPIAFARDTVETWQKSTAVTISENRAPGATQDFSKGAIDAPVTIVEFSDFECPACRRFYGEIKEIMGLYGDKIRVVHRNFPIDRTCNVHIPQMAHLNACFAALFTRCAGEQGRFWDATDYVFTLPSIDAGESPEKVAADITAGGAALGLDTAAMAECMNADRQRARIIEDIDEAIELGLASTPAVWVNGRAVVHPSKATLIPIIDHLLAGGSTSQP